MQPPVFVYYAWHDAHEDSKQMMFGVDSQRTSMAAGCWRYLDAAQQKGKLWPTTWRTTVQAGTHQRKIQMHQKTKQRKEERKEGSKQASKEEGRKVGTKQGRKEGRASGRKEGRQAGRKEGRKVHARFLPSDRPTNERARAIVVPTGKLKCDVPKLCDAQRIISVFWSYQVTLRGRLRPPPRSLPLLIFERRSSFGYSFVD